ncbi:Protein YIF1B-A [Dufourea novaeangliae]|uniref:Protein YIF1B-A n=1 Tax=Dufourea novaeangliae TaxID=178035 RepID=A0A154P657_DUFNO|nr:Protein YIF1B-A [Dufourea novaeangliae]
MNHNHSSARRGKPKRLLDPSAGLSAPMPAVPQNPYVYNQQVPINNGMVSEFGFNVPEQPPPPYGFNTVPMQNYPSIENRGQEYSSPQFTTQLLAEPVVTNMAVQYGNALVGYGSQQFEKYVPVTALKYYFAVDTNYILTKLTLLLFPFTHKDWSVRYEQDVPLQPRFEKNALDLYIPTMAFVTYVVIGALILGIQERFSPLGTLASSALAWNVIEVLVNTVTLYIMHIETSLSTLDLLAYCGYNGSLAFFLMRSLKLRVIPQNDSSYTASGKPKRLLDPSTSLSAPTPAVPQNPYVYNQQVSINNGMVSEFGFNVPEQPPPPYGFNTVPMQNYPSNENHGQEYSSPQFTTQLLVKPVVTNMAVQYGNALVGYGSQQFEKYVPVTALKYYFAVDTNYILTKLTLLLFPFTHKDWSVRYKQDVPLQPRFENNALDLYIPTMAFVTYVVIGALILGIQERFSPLGTLASSALAWNVIEVLVNTVTLYIMHIETSLSTLDLLAYCGYNGSLAFFLMRSLKLRVIPQNDSSYTASGNKRRLYFILFVAGIQPVLMWCLSYHLI